MRIHRSIDYENSRKYSANFAGHDVVAGTFIASFVALSRKRGWFRFTLVARSTCKNLVEIFPRRFRANRHRLDVNFGQMEPRDPCPASSVPLRRVDNAITISDMEALLTHRHLGARVIDKSQFRFLAGQQHADGLLSGFVVCNEPVIQIQILSGVQLKREMTTQR